MATLDTKVVLFGGALNGPGGVIINGTMVNFMNDTWTWDGVTWTEEHPATSPVGRTGHSMAALNGKIVMFGGEYISHDAYIFGALDETWTWDGSNWTKLSPLHAPSKRYSAAMTTLNGKIVLFGGYNTAGTYLGDTWTFDGTDWTQLAPATSPSGRESGMAAVGGTIVLFGGAGRSPWIDNTLSDTWTFDGSTWSAVATASAPSARVAPLAGP
jgi:N-acetylneuraminic acid mutarotase